MLETALLAAAGWLDAIGLRQWATAGAWVYPVANVVHVLGLAALVGAIGVLDLRVIGLWPRLPLAALSRALTPLAVIGLVLLAASGVILFAADGVALAQSWVYQLKLVLLVLALANALAFRRRWPHRALARTGMAHPLARLSALVSLLLWLMIAIAGRMIAYT